MFITISLKFECGSPLTVASQALVKVINKVLIHYTEKCHVWIIISIPSSNLFIEIASLKQHTKLTSNKYKNKISIFKKKSN